MAVGEQITPPPGGDDYGKYTVYRLGCPRCGAFYYGVTNKSVGNRLKEHRKKDTAPAKHEAKCDSRLTYRTLVRYDDRATAERYETSLIKAEWNNPLCLNEQISNKRKKRRGR